MVFNAKKQLPYIFMHYFLAKVPLGTTMATWFNSNLSRLRKFTTLFDLLHIYFGLQH